MAMLGQQLREGTMQTYSHVATAGQTSFPCSYGVGSSSVSVFQNGVLLSGSDINLTSGNAAVLNVAAAASDEITIQVQDVFSVADTVSAASGGTFTGNVSMSGTLGVTGAVTASNGLTVDDDGATPLTVDRATSNGTIIDVQKDGTSVGSIGNDGNDFYVTGSAANIAGIYLANSKAMPMKSGSVADGQSDLGNSSYRWKDLYLSGGAYLGGTGAANKLDSYEEGTWTPGIDANSGNGPTVSFPTSQPSGNYTKIGRQVHVSFYLPNFTVSGTVSGQIAITGLPFSSAGIPQSGGVISAYYITWARPNFVALKVFTNTTKLGFLSQNNGGGWGWETLGAISGSGKYLEGAITYFAA